MIKTNTGKQPASQAAVAEQKLGSYLKYMDYKLGLLYFLKL